MKQLFLLLTLAASLSVTAQTDKGNWMVGGNLGSVGGAFMTGNHSINGFGLSINPSAGYFVKNNLALGAGIQLTPWFSDRIILGYGISPFVRKYFGKGNTKTFAGLAVGYNGATTFDNPAEGYVSYVQGN